MKALSLIGFILSVFLIVLGIVSRPTASVLSNALIIGGALIALFLMVIWTISFIEEKKKRDDKTDF